MRGGDKRGMQSAALLVVKENWGYGGLNDRFRDLRVDDHSNPIQELNRIYKIHTENFPTPPISIQNLKIRKSCTREFPKEKFIFTFNDRSQS